MPLEPRISDPASGQTKEAIELYLRAVEEGSMVAIRNTQAGVLLYQMVVVTGTNARSGRLYTNRVGQNGGTSWFMKSGKNCFHPSGQSRLFMPTAAVEQFQQDHPTGVLSYDYYVPE